MFTEFKLGFFFVFFSLDLLLVFWLFWSFFLIIIIFCFVFFLLACIYNTTSARCRILTRICWRLLCSNLSTATHMVISRFAKCVHLIKYVSSKNLQIFDFRTFNLWHYVRVLFFTCVELSRLNASFYINRQQKITIMEILRHYWTHQLDGWKLKIYDASHHFDEEIRAQC